MSRTRALLFVSVLVALFATATVPAAAGPDDPDPLTLLPGRGGTEQLGLGTDVVTVVVCESPDPSENVMVQTPDEIVAWLDAEVLPYFTFLSGGRYTPDFVASDIVVPPTPFGCLSSGTAAGPTANTLVFDRRAFGGGLGNTGRYFITDTGGISTDGLTGTSSVSGRGLYMGGYGWLNPSLVAHEIGHTLGWPHSGSTQTNALTDYDNQTDLMSGGASEWDDDTINLCASPHIGPGAFTPGCVITNTMAINRYASGWIDVDEIEYVMRDGVTLDLMAPAQGGTQMALIPTASIASYLTVEARSGDYDAGQPFEGVLVHTINVGEGCPELGPGRPCWGNSRRQRPAADHTVDDGAHLVEVGDAKTFNGVTVTVEDAIAGGFTVSFSGNPAGCAVGVDPFVDVGSASFARNAVSCLKVLGITTGTAPFTYSPAADVTREQMAAFIGRLWRALDNPCADVAIPFTDVAPDSFAFDDVGCIFDLEVTTGTSPTTYGPSGFVTREQMGAFLARLWRALDNECSTEATPFTDIDGSFAADDIACIFHLGITTGTSPTTYEPGARVTREQMAAFLERFWLAAISV